MCGPGAWVAVGGDYSYCIASEPFDWPRFFLHRRKYRENKGLIRTISKAHPPDCHPLFPPGTSSALPPGTRASLESFLRLIPQTATPYSRQALPARCLLACFSTLLHGRICVFMYIPFFQISPKSSPNSFQFPSLH